MNKHLLKALGFHAESVAGGKADCGIFFHSANANSPASRHMNSGSELAWDASA